MAGRRWFLKVLGLGGAGAAAAPLVARALEVPVVPLPATLVVTDPPRVRFYAGDVDYITKLNTLADEVHALRRCQCREARR